MDTEKTIKLRKQFNEETHLDYKEEWDIYAEWLEKRLLNLESDISSIDILPKINLLLNMQRK